MKKTLAHLTDTLRLMVGVGNYQQYCTHMRQHHPDAQVLSETEYFRYGQEARYPSDKNRSIKRCPC